MKIRTRLTFLFTFLTATLLFLFASVIYISAQSDREKEFYDLLKKEAITKINLLFSAQVSQETLQDIYHSNREVLYEVEVAIYDTAFNLLYHDAEGIDFVKETREMNDEIIHNGEIRFYQQSWQVMGMLYTYDGRDYVITAAAYDQYGFSKLNSLLRNIVLVFIASIIVIFVVGFYFAKRAFDSVKKITSKARQISATNLDLRLTDTDSKDELAEMTSTFNKMLDRLENSFDAQKDFVSNISHELRTPLAAIIAELQLSLSKERTVSEYKLSINNALEDSERLVQLSNNLLDLAKANYDRSEISFKPIRVDELLLDARQDVKLANSSYKVDIHFEKDIDDEKDLTVLGNAYLLKLAFINLFDNGCKFSTDQKSIVSVNFTPHNILLRFSDRGIGIAKEDIPHVFSAFFRGENKQFAQGNGIGLSLTKKILELHHGTIDIESEKNVTTTFLVSLPHL